MQKDDQPEQLQLSEGGLTADAISGVLAGVWGPDNAYCVLSGLRS